jgi:prevent-host-death family protein
MHWQVQEAKQRFSELLRAAETGEPQIVTKHGEEIAVVLDIAEFRRLRGQALNIMEYLRIDPLDEVDLPVERSRDLPRDVDLSD